MFQKISTWQQKKEENIDEGVTNRKKSLVLIKSMCSFDHKKSVKSNKSEDSDDNDDDDDDDNRDNEGRIRIHSGKEVRQLNI